jgi:hypothetical protein
MDGLLISNYFALVVPPPPTKILIAMVNQHTRLSQIKVEFLKEQEVHARGA